MLDCLCVGIAVADHICVPIARLPKSGELLLTDRLTLSLGGHAANISVDLAKLAVKVGITARVGDDLFGEFLRRELTRAGVHTVNLVETPGQDTSGTLIVNVIGDDRRFIHTVGANGEFDGREVTPEMLRATRALYVGALFALPKLTAGALKDLLQQARAVGVPTVLDVVIPGPGDYLTTLTEVLPWTDVFMPNTDEAALITGESDPLLQAEVFRRLGARTVVITCGGDGAVVLSETDRFRTGSFRMEFVDGTGSGDAFGAGFIYGLLHGADTRRCVEIGSALGASAVRQSGATAGVFNRSELEAFLETNRLEFYSI
jgi:sugar/nucleoside kinase (ribokinase family)